GARVGVPDAGVRGVAARGAEAAGRRRSANDRDGGGGQAREAARAVRRRRAARGSRRRARRLVTGARGQAAPRGPRAAPFVRPPRPARARVLLGFSRAFVLAARLSRSRDIRSATCPFGSLGPIAPRRGFAPLPLIFAAMIADRFAAY